LSGSVIFIDEAYALCNGRKIRKKGTGTIRKSDNGKRYVAQKRINGKRMKKV